MNNKNSKPPLEKNVCERMIWKWEDIDEDCIQVNLFYFYFILGEDFNTAK